MPHGRRSQQFSLHTGFAFDRAVELIETRGIAAAEFVSHLSLAEFEWMRHVRNATEYPSEDRAPATALDVRDGIEAAEEIVSACRDHIHDVLASSSS